MRTGEALEEFLLGLRPPRSNANVARNKKASFYFAGDNQ